jgi:tetratricopeptide (TPR) repeat protein
MTISSPPLLIRLAAAACLMATAPFASTVAGAAGVSVPSVGSESSQPAPPAAQRKSHVKKKSTSQKNSAVEQFIAGYQAAYALIYEQGDYEAAITALRALDHDGNPDVATLLGYASRKLGRYDDAKYWYERALAADPNHAVTWSYYGMWQAEQGNVLKAKDDLEKVRQICGTDCVAYTMLKDAIDGTATY